MNVSELFPEIKEIENVELREKVVKSVEKALAVGGWNQEDLEYIPSTLLIPELIGQDNKAVVTLIDHTRMVTQLSMAVYDRYAEVGFADKIDRDILIAGGILHDIGKFVEYEKDDTGKIKQKLAGKYLRHPAQGLELVYEFDLPLKVKQAIMFHSKEGDKINRFIEVDIIHRCDFLCFDPIKKIYEKN